MQAKAYTMTHLLNPLKVIILGADKKDGNGGTFEFSVDNSKTRLTSSKLIDRYMESHGYYTRKQDSNIDTVRNGKRFFSILQKIKMKFLILLKWIIYQLGIN